MHAAHACPFSPAHIVAASSHVSGIRPILAGSALSSWMASPRHRCYFYTSTVCSSSATLYDTHIRSVKHIGSPRARRRPGLMLLGYLYLHNVTTSWTGATQGYKTRAVAPIPFLPANILLVNPWRGAMVPDSGLISFVQR